MLFVNEQSFRDEQGIFPIIVFERTIETFKCIGTASFINSTGYFITAAHVFENEIKGGNPIYIAQGLKDGRVCSRPIKDLSIHPEADIAVGACDNALDPLTAKEIPFDLAPHGRLTFKKLDPNTELISCGYPKGELDINGSLQTFSLKCTWSSGKVVEYHPNGFSLLKNKCYQTNFHIPSGCSGGPTYNDGLLVGVNSSSFDFGSGEEPVSFFTPIEYVLPLQLLQNGNYISVLELIKQGNILIG